ncbi:hypothetical protein NDU88_005640 [Pleurodeles waltl]|uniref:Uncharacterized protein n=1 Tax=Pleurodeles waltl TaxID=8319 RepID=A0AAV7RK87_PLEWA|nr:hypothetical protein NDU88_005640 [Pleurodeles waltl]
MDQFTAQHDGRGSQRESVALPWDVCKPSRAQILAAIEASGQAQITAMSVDVNLLRMDLRAVAQRPETIRDTKYKVDVLSALNGYIRENWNMAQMPGVEWEALKVVMRGVSLGKAYGIRKKLEQELMHQEEALTMLQNQGGEGANDEVGLLEVHRWIEIIRKRLDSYVRKDYRQQLHREGDRPGRKLAWLLKCERPLPSFLSLCGLTGGMILGQTWVNLLLQDHLRGVYASPVRADCSLVDKYLARFQLTKLTEAQTDDFEGDIRLKELQEALRARPPENLRDQTVFRLSFFRCTQLLSSVAYWRCSVRRIEMVRCWYI